LASRSPQSHAKRARELAVKEKRELKQAKKAERAAAREAEAELPTDLVDGEDAEEIEAADDTEEARDGEA
jgi:hypothetical protein